LLLLARLATSGLLCRSLGRLGAIGLRDGHGGGDEQDGGSDGECDGADGLHDCFSDA
jgi:hypothetical protein